jgi:hypothetical protein
MELKMKHLLPIPSSIIKTRYPHLFLVLVCILTASCQNPAQWYPKAEVEVANHEEITSPAGTRQLNITLIVNNTGQSTISAGVITIKVTTNKHEYMQTLASNMRIIPSGKIAVSTVVNYYDLIKPEEEDDDEDASDDEADEDEDETLKDDKIEIFDSYFE